MKATQQMLNEVNTKAILHWGIKTQSVVCMEEAAELCQQISKQLRGKGDKNHLTEEMADVYICLDMLKKMYNIDPEQLEDEIWRKLARTEDRIKIEKQQMEGEGDDKL